MKPHDQMKAEQSVEEFAKSMRQELGSAKQAPVNELAWIQQRITEAEAKASQRRSWYLGFAGVLAAAAIALFVLPQVRVDSGSELSLTELSASEWIAPDMASEEALAMEDGWYELIGLN
jgi:hypothetical protein